MISPVTQRWRDRVGSYRPAGETINTSHFEVAPLQRRSAKSFVLRHHYSGTFPAARFCFGLHRGAELVGTAVFSVPCNNAAITKDLPLDDAMEGAELGRLVLLDNVPGNGESWFVARCFELLRREELKGIISFSDPVPRTATDGRTVFKGHLGTIYQALNAVYRGLATPRSLYLFPDGTVFSERALAKIKARAQGKEHKVCRGWKYGVDLMVKHGAAPLTSEEDLERWMSFWLPRLTRRLRHQGNFKYIWALDKKLKKHLPESLPYPKLT